ncbi:unnamed protein product, partial [Ilex paraguariensis]
SKERLEIEFKPKTDDLEANQKELVESWDVVKLTNDYLKYLGVICDTYRKELNAKKDKVVSMDATIAELKDESATTWAKSYFSF